MRISKLFVNAAMVSIFYCNSSSAALIQTDLHSPGDGLVMRDTVTELDWLAPAVTTGISFEGIQMGEGGWSTDGWRHATSDEICGLFSAAPCPTIPSIFTNANRSFVEFVQSLLGTTSIVLISEGTINEGFAQFTTGWYDDGNTGLIGLAEIQTFTNGLNTRLRISDNRASAQTVRGNFLVRAIPTPSTAGVIAIAGMFAPRRRRST